MKIKTGTLVSILWLTVALVACEPAPEEAPEPDASILEALIAAEAEAWVTVVLDTELPAGSEARSEAGRELTRLGVSAGPAIEQGLQRIPSVEDAVRLAASLPGGEVLDSNSKLASLAEARELLSSIAEPPAE